MGIFDFLKNKKEANNTTENNLDLLEWQNIIQHDNSDILYMSREQLYSATIRTYLPNVKRIIDDSFNLVNNTASLDVFFERYNLLITYMTELSTLEKYVDFEDPLPTPLLNNYLSLKEEWQLELIIRYVDKTLYAAKKLKTEKGQENRINKAFNNLLEYKDYFTPASLECIYSIFEEQEL